MVQDRNLKLNVNWERKPVNEKLWRNLGRQAINLSTALRTDLIGDRQTLVRR